MPGNREASITVYLMEELGDARLRCDQLVRQLADVVKLVEQSKQRDHLFEVAGHLIHAIPETAFKLQKALQAVSLAADRLDYEELRQDLQPEKVEELERVLKDVRIRPVKRRSQPPGVTMQPKQVATQLRAIAEQTRKQGSMPVEALVGLIAQISSNQVKQASVQIDPAEVLEKIASTLETSQGLSRDHLAEVLTRLAKDVAFTQATVSDKQASAVSEEAQATTKEHYEKIRSTTMEGVHAVQAGDVKKGLLKLTIVVDHIATLMANLGSTDITVKADALNREILKTRRGKLARYEEGVPADPTENMTPADAEAWKAYNDEYGDKFKTAAEVEYNKVLKLLENAYKRGVEIARPGMDIPDAIDAFNMAKSKIATAVKTLEKDSYPGGVPISILADLSNSVVSLVRAKGSWTEAVNVAKFGVRTAEEDEEKQSKFEEGKPADPTENMSEADANKWKIEHLKNKDNFKEASEESLRWKAAEAL